jgi:hypothetical protein
MKKGACCRVPWSKEEETDYEREARAITESSATAANEALRAEQFRTNEGLTYSKSDSRSFPATRPPVSSNPLFDLIFEWLPLATLSVKKPSKPGAYTIGILERFRWFCGKESRETILLAIHDLRVDVRQMKAKKCSRLLIRCVVLWQVSNVIFKIMIDGLIRSLRNLIQLASVFRKLKGGE